MKTQIEMMKQLMKQIGLSRVTTLVAIGILMSGLSAIGENVVFKKSFDLKVYHDGNGDDSLWGEPEKDVAVGKIDLLEGEQLNSANIMSVASGEKHTIERPYIKWLHNGLVTFSVKYPEFGKSVNYTYSSRTETINNVEYEKWVLDGLGSLIVGGSFPIYGPATIDVKLTAARRSTHSNGSARVYAIPNQMFRITAEKTTVDSAQARTEQQVVVLPKGSGVNELVLESSEDLVNWEKDSLGDKNTDAANRFYRLRAIKK